MKQFLHFRPEPKDWKGEPWTLIEHKEDGHRATIFINEDSWIEVIGKKERVNLWDKLAQNDRMKEAIESLPLRTILDGEIVCGGNATEVPTALNEGRAEFICFAIPYFGGISYVNSDPALYRHRAEQLGFRIPVQLEILPEEISNKSLEMVLKDNATHIGIEGFVLKNKAWRGWYRIKPKQTIDLVVTGWKAGKIGTKYEKYLGSLEGSIYINGKLTPVAFVSGWKDEQRKNLSWDIVANRVMEVEFDKWESKGRLRFPQFKRWRPDKPQSQCVKE